MYNPRFFRFLISVLNYYYRDGDNHICFLIQGSRKLQSIGKSKCISQYHILPSLHAEVACLNNKDFHRMSLKKRRMCSLIVVKLDADGNFRNSRPCFHCMEKIKKSGIKKIMYSTNDGDIECTFVDHIIEPYISSGWRYRYHDKKNETHSP